jgi:hypothetical protein
VTVATGALLLVAECGGDAALPLKEDCYGSIGKGDCPYGHWIRLPVYQPPMLTTKKSNPITENAVIELSWSTTSENSRK